MNTINSITAKCNELIKAGIWARVGVGGAASPRLIRVDLPEEVTVEYDSTYTLRLEYLFELKVRLSTLI